MSNNLPLGVFDSGLGGLCALSEIRRLLPNEDIIYFGDTGRVPYGSRSEETIIKYATEDMNFLASHKVKAVLAACGTVSCVALDKIKNNYPFFSTGIVDASVEKAALATKNKKIAVVGTQATVSNGAFERKLKEIDPEIEVIGISAPLLVALVENGFISPDEEITALAVKRYLERAIEKNADTVILACTHFPLISHFFEKFMPDATVINAGKAAAEKICEILHKDGLLSDKSKGSVTYFVSDTPQNFTATAKMFLGTDEKIEPIRTKITD